MRSMHAPIRGTRSGTLSADDFRPSARDRRREDRIESCKPIRVFTRLNDERIGYLSDCSPHGVCVLLRSPLHPGEEFVLKVYLDQPRLVVYNARSCEPEPDGWYRVGGILADVVGLRNGQEFEAIFRALIEASEL